MNFDGREILTSTMVLFAVIDIIGSIPLILRLRKYAGGHIQSEKASIASLCLMIVFLFLGDEILSIIGVTVSSFAVAGSLVMFFIALEMILGIEIHKFDAPKTASIVPLAFPLIVGAGNMTTLLSLRAEFAMQNIIIGICINALFVYLVLKFSSRIERFMGKEGIAVIQRIFGVVLLAIAIKLFASNVKGLF